MKPKERNVVRRDQINLFLNSYFIAWRLNQILMIEKILHEKHNFFKEIILETKRQDDKSGEATIAQEITNGLHFDAISNAIQYIEDLFALLNAAKNPDYFIKNIVTYKAGKIEAMIKKKYTLESICDLFYFPYFSDLKEEDETDIVFLKSYEILESYFLEIQEFYKQYYFFYSQYKHGLTVALRPFGLSTKEYIEEDKKGNHKPYLVAFDNLAIAKLKGENIRFNKMAFLPGFTEPIRRNLVQLQKEDNLTRFVFPPIDTSISKIKSVAKKTKVCLDTVTSNLSQYVNNKPNKLQLPAKEYGKNSVFTFPKNPFKEKKGSS